MFTRNTSERDVSDVLNVMNVLDVSKTVVAEIEYGVKDVGRRIVELCANLSKERVGSRKEEI